LTTTQERRFVRGTAICTAAIAGTWWLDSDARLSLNSE